MPLNLSQEVVLRVIQDVEEPGLAWGIVPFPEINMFEFCFHVFGPFSPMGVCLYWVVGYFILGMGFSDRCFDILLICSRFEFVSILIFPISFIIILRISLVSSSIYFSWPWGALVKLAGRAYCLLGDTEA